MSLVSDYILNQSENRQAIMMYLQHLFMRYENITLKISFKIPMFYQHKWVCYMNPIKKDGIELVFMRGVELDHPALNSKKRKWVAGMEIHNLEEISEELVLSIFEEALALDINVHNASKSKGK